ncbi:MAG: histidinol-phosphate transaminase [Clostridiales bacterium]|nr:histidinol-phosphate transaminase [Clostridiales bacterium]
MSKFLNESLLSLKPYIPGEQPKKGVFVKLNTNENPYFLSKYAVDAVTRQTFEKLNLYSDPESYDLRKTIAQSYKVNMENVIVSNGSDEVLAFIFIAFCQNGVAFPDITYGFYKVFASLFNLNCTQIPLNKNFDIVVEDYKNLNKAIVLANPNAQTGKLLTTNQIKTLLEQNKNSVVVIDEAYIDFGGESAVYLTKQYKNLIVVQTFSKSRSLAGARVGFAIADKELIEDLNKVKNSFNPYNVNRISSLVAQRAMQDEKYFKSSCKQIIYNRERLVRELKKLGFEVIDSSANFIMAKSNKIGGEELYLALKKREVLVRHFNDERIKEFVRITVGTSEQVDMLLYQIKRILDV